MIVSSWAQAFPGTAEQVSAARRFVSTLLKGSPFAEDSGLVVSELFTNSVLHSDSGRPGGLVTVQVSRWQSGVRIAVTDQGSSGQQPIIRDTEPSTELAESGSGLYLVGQLAELDWHDDASGRTVHATLGIRPQDHHDRHLLAAGTAHES